MTTIEEKKKANHRRYRIHAKLKKVCRLNARAREIITTEQEVMSLDKRHLIYLEELRDVFKYNVQFQIA